MFKRPSRKPQDAGTPPDPGTELRGRIEALEEERTRLLQLVSYLQNAALQMHSTISEHAALARQGRLPVAHTLAAMVELQLDVLAQLPLDLLQARPGAAQHFKALIGHPPEKFENPVLTSAELLGFRIHTASRLLMALAYDKRVDATEVRYQAQNDVNVILEHERARYQHRNAKGK